MHFVSPGSSPQALTLLSVVSVTLSFTFSSRRLDRRIGVSTPISRKTIEQNPKQQPITQGRLSIISTQIWYFVQDSILIVQLKNYDYLIKTLKIYEKLTKRKQQ